MADNSKPQQPPKLTPKQKEAWNKFIDFVATQKMTGHPSLDQRNKNVGMGLLQTFNLKNPDSALPLEIVPIVQRELNDYRNEALAKWKSGKAVIEGVKTDEDFMPNLSAVDGWPGTKTLSSKFPGATLTVKTDKGTEVKQFGQDHESYNKAIGMAKNK